MQLYLLRHAEAEDVATRDDQRALTNKGEKQARNVAKFCRTHSILPEVILSSPSVRAEQTARIFAAEVDLRDSVELKDFLRPGMTAENALSCLEKYSEKASILLVGHEPDFSKLAGFLIGTSGGNIHFRKATLMSVSLAKMEPGAGTVDFLIPVKCL